MVFVYLVFLVVLEVSKGNLYLHFIPISCTSAKKKIALPWEYVEVARHVLWVGHLVIESLEHRRHLGRNGAAHQYHVSLARTVASHFKSEAGNVVACSAYGHKLNAAAAGGKRQRPQRVAAPPVDEVVQLGHNHVGAVLIELLHQFLVSLVVLKLLVGEGLNLGSLFYFHANAPFLQAYARPRTKMTRKNNTASRQAPPPVPQTGCL